MGFIGSIFNGNNGAGYQASLSNQQIQQAQQQQQNALQQQQNFANALATQNSINNQGAVFNQQQALANQLQGVVSGQGPNPALAQLAQTTGQNVQNQMAMAASQRNAAANPGLVARQGAQAGAGAQQQAVGQAATLAAQQQLGAMGQLGQQQDNMGNLVGQQVAQYQNELNALNQTSLQNQGQQMGMQQNANAVNAQIAAGNQQAQSGILGGLMGGAGLFGGSFMGMGTNSGTGIGGGGSKGGGGGGGLEEDVGDSFFARGGQVKMADGGSVPQSSMGKFLQGYNDSVGNQMKQNPTFSGANSFGTTLGTGLSKGIKNGISGLGNLFKNNESINNESNGENEINYVGDDSIRDFSQMAAYGGKIYNAKSGGHIPGKAKVNGDSYKNDTVNAKLSPGEIVIPRSVALAPDAAEKAKRFVEAVLAKKGLSK